MFGREHVYEHVYILSTKNTTHAITSNVELVIKEIEIIVGTRTDTVSA